MQTFLPYPDYRKSAQVLDRQRLGKQRVEGMQILKALSDSEYGWQNHPATKMWRNCPVGLGYYTATMIAEWVSRGYKDTCLEKINELLQKPGFAKVGVADKTTLYPDWFGDEEFHLSHQSNLIRKNPEFYRPIFGDVPDDLEYVWPV